MVFLADTIFIYQSKSTLRIELLSVSTLTIVQLHVDVIKETWI